MGVFPCRGLVAPCLRAPVSIKELRCDVKKRYAGWESAADIRTWLLIAAETHRLCHDVLEPRKLHPVR